MTERQVFFSFEYRKDNWRAAQVRNMGKVSDSSTFSDNDWEEVKEKTDRDIKAWIDAQLAMRSFIVVLVGETTSTRKWVKYEIQKAYELNKGIVGIYVHNLKDSEGNQTKMGGNPFDKIYTNNGDPLSEYVTCYNPPYSSSTSVYGDIESKIVKLIEDAISNKVPQ